MKIKNLLLSFLLAGLVVAVGSGCTPPHEDDGPAAAPYADMKVTVEGGKIRGTETENKDVAVFKGIPYAAAPIGDLRFKSPQPVVPWENELDCSLWGSCALQNTPNTAGGIWTAEFQPDLNPEHYRNGEIFSEDCLYLNVWSSYKTYENKPVLVYIHGGAYNTGGSSAEIFDGANIARHDVVYVSINYRLGYLGFIATKNLKAENDGAGNYGILDQIAALKWVKNNINVFGGDPENVTVMGQSAGAGSLTGLISSPKADGLFKNAVTLSEEPYSGTWQTIDERMAKINGSFASSPVEDLRKLSADSFKGMDISPSGPCIDGEIITGSYKSSVKKRTVNSVNLMCGNVAYDDNRHISIFTDFYSTGEFTVTENMLGQHNARAKDRNNLRDGTETFVYLFEREVPLATTGSNQAMGPQHSYELYYFTGNFSIVSGREWTETDYELGEKMLAYLVNFCKNGNPNGEDMTEWIANTGNYHYMNFADAAQSKLLDADKAQAVSKKFGL